MSSSLPSLQYHPSDGYPPPGMYSNASPVPYSTSDNRQLSRTPSPTPSEQAELSRKSVIDFKTIFRWRYWLRREWIKYYIILIVVLVLVALMSIYHTQIVDWLTPAANWMHNLKFGWLIPIAIFFVISFPPLFGHEILAILCGLVWGLWIGFAITAAGTLIGEIGNFYAFRYCCSARGEKLERTKTSYACLAKIVRDGGFKIALIARLSAIPGHFTTAVFSTCGMGFFTFLLAAILSLPKQFITVYLGVLLEESSGNTNSSTYQKNKIISDVVLAITFIITFAAMWYILRKMNEAKPAVIYARRKARQSKMDLAGPYGVTDPYASSTALVFNPQSSDIDIPLNPSANTSMCDVPYQQWDSEGRAVGYAGDPRVLAPQPRRAANLLSSAQNGPSRTGSRAGPREDGEGYVYPAGSAAQEGRSPLRQESMDISIWQPSGRSDYDLAVMPSLPDPYANSGPEQQPFASSQAPYASYQPSFASRASPSASTNPFSTRTSNQISSLPPGARQPSRPEPPSALRTFSPPPPSYHTTAPP